MAAQAMCEGNYTLRESKLIDELHQAILDLYDEGNIPHLHSCLKENIKSALGRLTQLEKFDARSYYNQDGSQVVYLSCPIERKPEI